MKILFRTLALLSLASCATAVAKNTVTIKGDDSTIRYVGRTLVDDGAVSFDWSGTYLEFKFVGEGVTLHAGDSAHSYYNCIVDGKSQVIEIASADTLITLSSGLKSKAEHSVRLQKRTEGSQGLTTIKGFEITGRNARMLEAPKAPERHIEFIGDSYTCGYGVESTVADGFSGETENCNLAHGGIIARLFDADYTFIANSGRGMVRNYGDKNTTSKEGTMPKLVTQTFNTKEAPAWDFSSSPYSPDIVVIFLGINDFSTQPSPSVDEFSAGYKEMILTLRKGYGADVPILCIAPVTGGGKAKRAIDKMRNELGDNNIYSIEHFNNFMQNPNDLGAHYHPNVTGQRKVAMMAIPYISTITGWQIPERAIK